jgi:hypothetical protein
MKTTTLRAPEVARKAAADFHDDRRIATAALRDGARAVANGADPGEIEDTLRFISSLVLFEIALDKLAPVYDETATRH